MWVFTVGVYGPGVTLGHAVYGVVLVTSVGLSGVSHAK